MDNDARRSALALAEVSTLQSAAVGAPQSEERAAMRDHGAGGWTLRGGVVVEEASAFSGTEFTELLPTLERDTRPTDRVIELKFGS